MVYVDKHQTRSNESYPHVPHSPNITWPNFVEGPQCLFLLKYENMNTQTMRNHILGMT